MSYFEHVEENLRSLRKGFHKIKVDKLLAQRHKYISSVKQDSFYEHGNPKSEKYRKYELEELEDLEIRYTEENENLTEAKHFKFVKSVEILEGGDEGFIVYFARHEKKKNHQMIIFYDIFLRKVVHEKNVVFIGKGEENNNEKTFVFHSVNRDQFMSGSRYSFVFTDNREMGDEYESDPICITYIVDCSDEISTSPILVDSNNIDDDEIGSFCNLGKKFFSLIFKQCVTFYKIENRFLRKKTLLPFKQMLMNEEDIVELTSGCFVERKNCLAVVTVLEKGWEVILLNLHSFEIQHRFEFPKLGKSILDVLPFKFNNRGVNLYTFDHNLNRSGMVIKSGCIYYYVDLETGYVRNVILDFAYHNPGQYNNRFIFTLAEYSQNTPVFNCVDLFSGKIVAEISKKAPSQHVQIVSTIFGDTRFFFVLKSGKKNSVRIKVCSFKGIEWIGRKFYYEFEEGKGDRNVFMERKDLMQRLSFLNEGFLHEHFFAVKFRRSKKSVHFWKLLVGV